MVLLHVQTVSGQDYFDRIQFQTALSSSSLYIDSSFYPNRILPDKITFQRVDFNLYLQMEKNLNNYFSLILSPGFVHRGTITPGDFWWTELSDSEEKYHFKFQYVSLPAFFRIHVPDRRKFSPYLEIAPRVDIMVNKSYTAVEKDVMYTQIFNRYRRVALGYSGGIGIRENISRYAVSIGLKLNLDATSSYRDHDYLIKNINGELYFSFSI